MELLSSNIKASLQSETTEEEQHHTSSAKIDCCLNQINQAIETIEKALFSDNDYNKNTHQALVECDNSDITTEDKVKLLTAQVESLKEQLLVKESELQATQQELKYTNEDLIAALKTDILTLESAKELAKNMLGSLDSIYGYAAKLLSAIYNSTVEASELAPIHKEDITLKHELNKLKTMRKALKEENIALRTESISLRNKVAELTAKSKDIINRTATYKKTPC